SLPNSFNISSKRVFESTTFIILLEGVMEHVAVLLIRIFIYHFILDTVWFIKVSLGQATRVGLA
ncbi:MAG: hypothetical protein DRJ51_07860, partial [Thermoprotei archaeon]